MAKLLPNVGNTSLLEEYPKRIFCADGERNCGPVLIPLTLNFKAVLGA